MSQPYWVEVKVEVEVELRLIFGLRLIVAEVEVRLS